MRLCTVEGCGKSHKAKGLCNTHYKSLTRYGTLTGPPSVTRGCTVEGCERRHMARGWCAAHHARWYRYGDPTFEHPTWNRVLLGPPAPPPSIPTEKACNRCGEVKVLDAFHVSRSCRDGRRGECKVCARRRTSEWSRDNAARKAAYNLAWQAANPERWAKLQKLASHRRRGRLAGTPEHLALTLDEWEEVLAWHDGLCVYCGDEATEMEHIIPVARGGAHTQANVAPACKPCNRSKRATTAETFAGAAVAIIGVEGGRIFLRDMSGQAVADLLNGDPE